MSGPDADLAFLPLGGTGEIGMNLNLYRCGGKWLAVDCGIGFGGAEYPEVEIMVPDPAFIADRRDRLVGLVITHAHEDHIGGVAWLWPMLRCPVYATPFAAAVLRRKLAEVPLLAQVPIHVVAPGSAIELPPFSLRLLRVAHSIPESQALAITTPAGIVLHTGDWKLDPDPMVGPPTDEAAFAALGEQGVLAMVCDSTNAMVEGHSGSESEVRRSLAVLIRGLRGRVAVTCFASNIARIESIALAARDAGRSTALVGRSLRNVEAAARECGYLRGVPDFVPEDEAGSIPDDNLLILITGSQGEPRSALARVALDTHSRVVLGEGDTVIFSSRVIPGNERAIGTVQDNLVRRGVNLMTEVDHLGRAGARRMAASRGACRTGARGRDNADAAGGWRYPEFGAWSARGRGQRSGRQAGAGWRAPGAADRRGHGGAAADAVQRRGARQPRGGCQRAAVRRTAGQRPRTVRGGRP